MGKKHSDHFLDPDIQRMINLRNSLYKKKTAGRSFMGVLAMVGILAVLAVVGKMLDRHPAPPASGIASEASAATVPEPAPADEPSPAPVAQEVAPAIPPYQQTMNITLGKGDNLFDALSKEKIPAAQIHELVVATKPVHDLGRVRQGQTLALDFDNRDGTILRFETAINGDGRLVVKREGEQLQAEKETFDFETRTHVVSGIIEDSLCLAADEAGLPPTTTLDLAEIFAWDIDFQVDMRKEDTFRVLYERKYLDEDFVHPGQVLAAEIVNQRRSFQAFYFEDSSGHTDYYDQEGRSLRRAFLRSPLKYTRISSRFSRRRFHPILKTYRPHLGVDYAAPSGTPVRTIGDGKVIYAGWKNGFGRYIETRHNGTYTSTYGHLSSFAKDIKKGKFVSQGQVIGYVGQTGLATGPHLDFRLLKNNSFVNPLTVNIPSADPVPAEDMTGFKRRAEQFMAELNGSDFTKVALESPFNARLIP